MSEVHKRVCDRCGRTIVSYDRTTLILRRSVKLNITERFGLGPYDYAKQELDLCDVCTKKLKNFLSESEVENNER